MFIISVFSPTRQDKYFPTARKKFSRVPNLKLWRQETYNCLNLVARQIESRFGRQVPAVVASPVVFSNTKTQLFANILQKFHARLSCLQCESYSLSRFILTLQFRNLARLLLKSQMCHVKQTKLFSYFFSLNGTVQL